MPRSASYERVTAALRALEGTYGSVPVRQTTVNVGPGRYEALGDDDGVVDAQVHVSDGDRALVIRDGGRWTAPAGAVGPADRIERAARRAVEHAAGVDCRLTDLDHVVITGVNDRTDPERPTRYRLTAVFEAEYVDGDPADGAEWRTDSPDLATL